MKQLKIVVILMFVVGNSLLVFSQKDKPNYYKIGFSYLQNKDYRTAILNFDLAIKQDSTDSYSYYNRGLSYYMISNYGNAIADFNKTLVLDDVYANAYYYRGLANRMEVKYKAALADFDKAIEIDAKHEDAYFQRGNLLRFLGRITDACADYVKVREFGNRELKLEEGYCGDSTKIEGASNQFMCLKEKSSDKDYGFSSSKPIKVGYGFGSSYGPENERIYILMLRDSKGERVGYERKGSCCGYDSKNAPLGVALLDEYEITFYNEKGKLVKRSIFISMYDYEEPKALQGLNFVSCED